MSELVRRVTAVLLTVAMTGTPAVAVTCALWCDGSPTAVAHGALTPAVAAPDGASDHAHHQQPTESSPSTDDQVGAWAGLAPRSEVRSHDCCPSAVETALSATTPGRGAAGPAARAMQTRLVGVAVAREPSRPAPAPKRTSATHASQTHPVVLRI